MTDHGSVARLRIRRAFDEAAANYDAVSRLQRQVSHLLLGVIHRPPPARILDAGCGTGYALHLLHGRWPTAERVAVDFAPAMLSQAATRAPQVLTTCADLAALPFADHSFDLYWSNLAWQWCPLAATAREAARVLAEGGTLALSTLLPGTLHELEDAFAGLDHHRHVRAFASVEAVQSALQAAGLVRLRFYRRCIVQWQPNLGALLRDLRALGAHTLDERRRGLMGKQAWRQIEARYEQRRQPQGLPVTWEILLCIARQPIS